MTKLEQMVKELPPDLQKEVEDFIEFLHEKKAKRKRGRLRMDWAGALSDMKDQYTSVELQHKISEWRIGKE